MQCPQTNCLQWRLKARVKTDDYYMLVTRLISRNKHIFRPLLVQVSKRSLMLCAEEVNPKKRPIKNSRPDGSQSYQKREREKKKKNLGGDVSGTVVTVSAIKTGNGCSRNILLDTRGMNGHDRSTNTNDKKRRKKKNTGRDQNSTPFPHLLAYIHIYTYGYVHIYMYIYRDWLPWT